VADLHQANGTTTHGTTTHGFTETRRFGYWAGHLVVVGSMIGAGILTTSGFTLRETGNPPALLVLWALGGLLALCGAVTVAELATTLPRSGGDYVFVREAFGRGAGFVSGWATFTLGFAAPTAVVAHLAITYLVAPYTEAINAQFPAWASENFVRLGATALILWVGLVHTLGHQHSSRLQLIATVATVGILLALAVGGIVFGNGDWRYLAAGGWPSKPQWAALAIGLIYVSYAYTGWNAAAYLAGEVRDPARTLPRCLIGGVTTVIVLYLMVNLAYVYALDPAEMMARPESEVERVAELAAASLFGPQVAGFTAAAFGLCLVAGVSAYLLTGPRVAYAMARDHVFPRFAGKLHPARGTPALATLTQATLAAALVWSGSFLELLNYTAVGLAALAGLTIASVFPLRRRADLPRPYRLPLYPIPPLTFLLLAAWTVGSTVYQEVVRDKTFPGPAVLSLLTLLIGIPLSMIIADPHRAAKS
jgi:APA family basic amino acid/polyamine antiporter